MQAEETDPTVPGWAKAEQKPAYTAEEVGALPADTKIPEPYTLPVASADTLGGVKVGKGLQMDGDVLAAKVEGEYELIETITMEEDVKSYTWSQDQGYKKILIFIETPIVAEYTANPDNLIFICVGEKINYNKVAVRLGEVVSAKYIGFAMVHLKCCNGRIFGDGAFARNSMSNVGVYNTTPNSLGYILCDEIKQITIGHVNGTLYADTKITIWGVQA